MAEETNESKRGRGRPRKDENEGNIVTPIDSSASGPVSAGSPAPITQRDTSAGVKTKYVSLKIAEDGSLDLSKMKDKGKTELREAIVKTQRKGELGPANVPETFTPESMQGYVALLMSAEASLSVRFLKISPEIATEVFAPNVQEIRAISVPAAKVANKYLAEFKYADEMALLGAIAEVTFAKIMLCRYRMSEETAKRNPVQHINGQAHEAAV